MHTRRRFLASAGVAAAALAGCLGNAQTAPGPTWDTVECPTNAALYDVAAAKDGPYAVGEGGVVLRRGDDGWEMVVRHGPHALDSSLVGVDATTNGGAVWFCGESGVVGRYDVANRRVTDASAPREKTSSWEAVGVVGLAGREWVFLVNGSGEVFHGTYDGRTVHWEETPAKPGGGASAYGITFDRAGFGYVADSTSHVYQTVDAGRSWKRIGIPDASVTLHDVAAVSSTSLSVAGGDGLVYRFDGFDWTPRRVASNDLLAVSRTRRAGLAVGGAGTVLAFTASGWEPREAATGETLHGVALGGPAVAVGESGTVLERAD